MSYNSKYTGREVEEAIDKVEELNVAIVDYVTKAELDSAIAQAITTTLNTEV